ncbi:lymphocyte antigen 6E-like isoform X2 [Bombina bombina]|uniref:lymphocyte antigen 6E-like isoform X2 n=1 Tax=Bombina bombina TaxID=8345 RepID=UPI00235A9C45|nr:lymphocyte antigen 6E-like isoform X2 [Bombina bombina]
MESAQVLVLVMTLCIGTAYSLSCYTCTNEGSNSNCMTAVNCTAGTDSYCKMSVLSVVIAYSLSCYTCTNEGSNSNCMTAVNCTAGTDSYCKTSVLSVAFYFDAKLLQPTRKSPGILEDQSSPGYGGDKKIKNNKDRYTVISITKECASACTEVTLHSSSASNSVSCCNTNLCNTSGASSVKSSSATLALSVGLFLALLGKSSL